MVGAALATTEDMVEAKAASLVGVLAQQAAESAARVARLLANMVDLRMQKLENWTMWKAYTRGRAHCVESGTA